MSEMTTVAVTVNGVALPDPPGRRRDGASEAVVFVHGNPGPKEDWQDLVPATGDFARAIAPDFPGYGAADKPEQFDYTSAGYAAHLNGILGQLGIERVHLVMHDFGGAWGLMLGGPAPRSVRERDADQHRRAARLLMASSGQDLAHARPRRGVHGDDQQEGVPAP